MAARVKLSAGLGKNFLKKSFTERRPGDTTLRQVTPASRKAIISLDAGCTGYLRVRDGC